MGYNFLLRDLRIKGWRGGDFFKLEEEVLWDINYVGVLFVLGMPKYVGRVVVDVWTV